MEKLSSANVSSQSVVEDLSFDVFKKGAKSARRIISEIFKDEAQSLSNKWWLEKIGKQLITLLVDDLGTAAHPIFKRYIREFG